ncbi:MAG: recombinase RecT [Planctomycetes bacterium]|nr:recombinase RecT [Planctomycetota bacterium]
MSTESKSLATRPANPMTEIIEPRTSELVQVFMGDAAKAERFKTEAATLVLKDPSLASCQRQSIWLALKCVAELDLSLTPSLGQAYILPFNSKVRHPDTKAEMYVLKAQLILGYKGMKEIAYRSGVVRKLESVLVYENDQFSYQRGTDPKIVHIPAEFGKRGKVSGAYATATLANGEVVFEVMSREEIEAIKKKSKSQDVWNAHPEEMARKTPIRRLFKYLPTTPLLSRALAVIEDDPDSTESLSDNAAARRPRLADHLAGRDAGADAPPEPEHESAPEPEPEHAPAQPATTAVAARTPITEDDIPF